MDPIWFNRLIETLNKIDCPTIIISILGAAISAFVAYKAAKFQANKSDEQIERQVDSQEGLKKEIFFRQSKYEKVQLLMRDCDEIKIFCLGQVYSLFRLYHKYLSTDDLDGYEEVVSNRSLTLVFNTSAGTIDIKFDEEETGVVRNLKLEERYNDIISKPQVINDSLQPACSMWGLEGESKCRNHKRYSKSIDFIKDLLDANLLLDSALEELDRYNLYKLINRDIPADYVKEAKRQIREKYEKVKISLQEELD